MIGFSINKIIYRDHARLAYKSYLLLTLCYLLSIYHTHFFVFIWFAAEWIDLYYSVQKYQFYLPWRDFSYLLYNVGKEESIKQNRSILLYKNEAVNFSNFFHTSFITKRKRHELGHKLCFQMVRDIFNLTNFFVSFEGFYMIGPPSRKSDIIARFAFRGHVTCPYF